MSEFSEIVKLLDLQLTTEQEFACLFLESRGLRFCVHFGLSNAFEKACDIAQAESGVQ